MQRKRMYEADEILKHANMRVKSWIFWGTVRILFSWVKQKSFLVRVHSLISSGRQALSFFHFCPNGCVWVRVGAQRLFWGQLIQSIKLIFFSMIPLMLIFEFYLMLWLFFDFLDPQWTIFGARVWLKKLFLGVFMQLSNFQFLFSSVVDLNFEGFFCPNGLILVSDKDSNAVLESTCVILGQVTMMSQPG